MAKKKRKNPGDERMCFISLCPGSLRVGEYLAVFAVLVEGRRPLISARLWTSLLLAEPRASRAGLRRRSASVAAPRRSLTTHGRGPGDLWLEVEAV